MRDITVLAIMIILLAGFSSPVVAGTKEPAFSDFPSTAKYRGKNAPVKILAKDRMFRTRLKEASEKKPNFAGHYIFTTWGCGFECVMGAVIDANTGEVIPLPFTVCCWGSETGEDFKPVEFRRDSKLVIFSGARNEQEGDNGRHFYVLENKRFIPLPKK